MTLVKKSNPFKREMERIADAILGNEASSEEKEELMENIAEEVELKITAYGNYVRINDENEKESVGFDEWCLLREPPRKRKVDKEKHF